MAVSYVGRGGGAASIGAISVPLPGGVVAGDLMILFVETAEQSVSTPAGWTSINAFGSSLGAGGASSTRVQAFYKRAGVGEGSVSVADAGDRQIGQIMVFRGAKASGNPVLQVKSNVANLDAGGDIALGTWATVTPGSMVAIAFGHAADGTTSSYTISGFTTGSGSFGSRVEQSGTDDGTLHTAYAINVSATSISANPSIKVDTIFVGNPAVLFAIEIEPAPDPIDNTVTALLGAFTASASVQNKINTTTTATLEAFTASASIEPQIGIDADLTIAAFEASAIVEHQVDIESVILLEAFTASAEVEIFEGDEVIASSTIDLSAFEAAAEVTLLNGVTLDATIAAFEATAEVTQPMDVVVDATISAFTGGLMWVFVGTLEVPGDADYKIAVPALDRAAVVPAQDRTATVPGLDRTLKVP